MPYDKSLPLPTRMELLENDQEFLGEAYFRHKKQLEEQEQRIQSLEKLLGDTIHSVADLILAFSKAGWGLPAIGQPTETAEKLQ